MRLATACIAVCGAFLLFAPGAALAASWIDLQVVPTFPDHVENPGGTATATATIHTDLVVDGQIQVTILDPDGNTVLDETYAAAPTFEHQWSVLEEVPDGLYHYRVGYMPTTGEFASAQRAFFVIGRSTGICAFKIIDNNANGQYDAGIDSLAAGWEICVTPGLGCKITEPEYGSACWFFITPGVYEVCETLQEGYYPVVPVCQTVEVQANVIVEVDFYNTPLGACCFCVGGECQNLTEEQCLGQSGQFMGDYTECYPGLCHPSPVERTSWGLLKHIYR